MTKIQKVVLAAGCAVLLLLLQFPPYLGIFLLEGDNVTRFLGFHHINYPPAADHLSWALHDGRSSRIVEYEYRSEIDFSRLALYVMTVVIAFGGLSLVLHRPKR